MIMLLLASCGYNYHYAVWYVQIHCSACTERSTVYPGTWFARRLSINRNRPVFSPPVFPLVRYTISPRSGENLWPVKIINILGQILSFLFDPVSPPLVRNIWCTREWETGRFRLIEQGVKLIMLIRE